MLEPFALGIIHHLEQRLELPPLRGVEVLQDEVLPQLQPHNLRFRMAVEGGHEVARSAATRKHGVEAEYNGKFLIEVKAKPAAGAYI
jgi:hypothetical protein